MSHRPLYILYTRILLSRPARQCHWPPPLQHLGNHFMMKLQCSKTPPRRQRVAAGPLLSACTGTAPAAAASCGGGGHGGGEGRKLRGHSHVARRSSRRGYHVGDVSCRSRSTVLRSILETMLRPALLCYSNRRTARAVGAAASAAASDAAGDNGAGGVWLWGGEKRAR